MSAMLHQQWYRLIHDTYLFLDANETHILDTHGLTNTAYRALLLLDPDNAKNLVTLSDELWCARSTVTRLIGKMEQNGWVERVIDPENRRAHLVTLSAAGIEVRNKARDAHAQLLADVLGDISASDLDHMIYCLEQVRDRLLANLGDEHVDAATRSTSYA